MESYYSVVSTNGEAELALTGVAMGRAPFTIQSGAVGFQGRVPDPPFSSK